MKSLRLSGEHFASHSGIIIQHQNSLFAREIRLGRFKNLTVSLKRSLRRLDTSVYWHSNLDRSSVKLNLRHRDFECLRSRTLPPSLVVIDGSAFVGSSICQVWVDRASAHHIAHLLPNWHSKRVPAWNFQASSDWRECIFRMFVARVNLHSSGSSTATPCWPNAGFNPVD
jgi:hypothetical protein